MKKFFSSLLLLMFLLASCNEEATTFDASGSFEATETIVSAEATGKLLQFFAQEGAEVNEGEILGFIDTTQLHLRRAQLNYSIQAVLARKPDAEAQLSTLRSQIESTQREQERITNLFKSEAATKKQVDDINAQMELLQRQHMALQSSLSITNRSLQSETLPLKAQLDQVRDQIKKSLIINPVKGTILTLYTLKDEVVLPGKALYKIADLSSLILRAYITADQLSLIKLGQAVKVSVDLGKEEMKSYEGTISWISDKSEFTPKTIQTKEERANLVFAIKVTVKNDGFIKSGMYGELDF